MKIKLSDEAFDELQRISPLIPSYGIPSSYPAPDTKVVVTDVGNAFTKGKTLYCDKRARAVLARLVGSSYGTEGYALWGYLEQYSDAALTVVQKGYRFPYASQ